MQPPREKRAVEDTYDWMDFIDRDILLGRDMRCLQEHEVDMNEKILTNPPRPKENDILPTSLMEIPVNIEWYISPQLGYDIGR